MKKIKIINIVKQREYLCVTHNFCLGGPSNFGTIGVSVFFDHYIFNKNASMTDKNIQ